MTRMLPLGILLVSLFFLAGCASSGFIPYQSKPYIKKEQKRLYFYDLANSVGFNRPAACRFFSKKDQKAFRKTRLYQTLEELKEQLIPVYAGRFKSEEQLPEYFMLFKARQVVNPQYLTGHHYQQVSKFFSNTAWDFFLAPHRPALFYYKRQQDTISCILLVNDVKEYSSYLLAYTTAYRNVDKMLNNLYNHWDPVRGVDSTYIYSFASARKKYAIDTLLQVYSNWRLYYIASSLTTNIEVLKTDFQRLTEARFVKQEFLDYRSPVDVLPPLEQAVENNPANYRKANEYYQQLATYSSFLGEHKDAITTESKFRSAPASFTIPEGFAVADARKEILTQAAGKKIIAFNESHHDVRSRALVYSLLDSLYKMGFNHLAIEDLRGDLNRGDVTINSGYYIREPVFHNMVNAAKELGYKLISYDRGISDFQKRDYLAARKILRQYNHRSSDKLIVFCGYDHLSKKASQQETGTVVQNLWHSTGIEPLTINLTAQRNRYLSDSTIKGFYILKNDANGSYFPLWAKRDIVVYPPTDIDHFDYGYYHENKLLPLFRYSYLLPVSFASGKHPHSTLYVFKGRQTHDFKRELPLFVKKLEGPAQTVEIYLFRPGAYDLYIRDQEEKLIQSDTINVQ